MIVRESVQYLTRKTADNLTDSKGNTENVHSDCMISPQLSVMKICLVFILHVSQSVGYMSLHTSVYLMIDLL